MEAGRLLDAVAMGARFPGDDSASYHGSRVFLLSAWDCHGAYRHCTSIGDPHCQAKGPANTSYKPSPQTAQDGHI